jgi:hypothetical protein
MFRRHALWSGGVAAVLVLLSVLPDGFSLATRFVLAGAGLLEVLMALTWRKLGKQSPGGRTRREPAQPRGGIT